MENRPVVDFKLNDLSYHYTHTKVDDFKWTMLVSKKSGEIVGRSQVNHDIEVVTVICDNKSININYVQYAFNPIKMAMFVVQWKN